MLSSARHRVAAVVCLAVVMTLFAASGWSRAGSVIYVDREANGFDNGTSWADAYEDLQDALASSTSGDEIWVAEGNYYPTAGADRTISFQLAEGVALYGGFDGTETARDERLPDVHTTTLSGDIGLQMEEGDNSHRVVVGANGAILDGFTIMHGNADGAAAPHDAGGGLYVAGTGPQIRNCTFWLNRAVRGGGACIETPSFPVFTDCLFRDNVATDGAGVYCEGTAVMFIRCRFDRNDADLWGGGLFCANAAPTLTNAVFFRNTADSGGGIHCRSGAVVRLHNCTLSRQSASVGGGSLHIDGAHAAIESSIIAYDLAGDGRIVKTNGGTDDVRFSSVGQNYPGTGNTNYLPEFADLLNGDLHLRSTVGRWTGAGWVFDFINCPLIDRGDWADSVADEPWPHGGRINMGAYGGTEQASKSRPVTPEPLSLEAESSTSVRAEWGPNGNPDGTLYQAECWLGDDEGVTYGAGGTQVGDTGYVADLLAHTFDGLAINTRYGVRIRAKADIPLEPRSYWAYAGSAYTHAVPPVAVDLDAYPDGRIEAEWAQGDNSDGTEYFCECHAGDGFEPPNPVANSGWTTDFRFAAESLTVGQLYSFRVKARNKDGVSTAWTDLGTVEAILGPRPPDAVDDTALVPEDSADNAINVLANDTDPNNDTLTIVDVTTPSHGSAAPAGGHVEYTPVAGYFGTDSFDYTVSDGDGGSDTATVTVTVSSKWTLDVQAPLGSGSTDPATGTYRLLPGESALVEATADPGWVFFRWAGTAPPAGHEEDNPLTVPTGSVTDTKTLTAVFVATDPVTSGNHHYQFAIVPAGITWDEAQAHAQGMVYNGFYGHLVAITSEAENDFVRDHVAPPSVGSTPTTEIWIGGYQHPGSPEPDGGWAWVTGEAWAFENWWQGEPNDWEGPGCNDALMIWSLRQCRWNDIGRTNALNYYIVEFEPGYTQPEASNDAATVDEDTIGNVINVLGNDTDDDGDTLQITDVSDPPHGTAAIAGDDIEYTPDTNFPNPDATGTDAFTYTASDGKGGTDTAEVTVTVNNVNDMPDAVDDVETVVQDSASNILQVLANDTDPENDGLEVTDATDPAHGSTAFTALHVEYTPAPGYAGADSFDYTVSDGNGGTDTATVTVTVEPPPSWTLAIQPARGSGSTDPAPGSYGHLVGQAASVQATEDTGGVLLYWTGDAVPSGHERDNPLAVPSGTEGQTKTLTAVFLNIEPQEYGGHWYQVVYRSAGISWLDARTEAEGMSHQGVTGHLVTIASEGENAFVLYNVAAPGDSHPYVTADTHIGGYQEPGSSGPADGWAWVTREPWGYTHWYWREPNDANPLGDDVLNFWPHMSGTWNDAHHDGLAYYYIVEYNPDYDPPTAHDDAETVAEDSTDHIIDVLANDTDPTNDPLQITDVTAAAHGTASIVGDHIEYTPHAGYPDPDDTGADSFDYTITDGNGGWDTATVTITVNNVNDPPDAVSDSYDVEPDSVDNVLHVLVNDSDAEGHTLAIASVTDPPHGGATFTSTEVQYTPDGGYEGADEFEYEVSDGHGGTASATVALTVAEFVKWTLAITPPQGSGTTSPAAGSCQYAVGQAASVQAIADADSRFLYWTGDAVPSGEEQTNPLSVPSGAAGEVKTLTAVFLDVSVKEHDGHWYQLVYRPGRISWDNAKTEAENATYQGATGYLATLTSAEENEWVRNNIAVSAESHQILCADTHIGAYQQAGGPEPDGGWAWVTDEPWDYTNWGLNEPSDQNGSEDALNLWPHVNGKWNDVPSSATAYYYIIEYERLNLPPVTTDDTLAVVEDSADNPIDVLKNDSDPEGDPLTLDSVTDPPHGTAAIVDDYIEYTPDPDFPNPDDTGTDSFDYTVSDGNGGTAAGTVTVTITNVNDPPDAVDDPDAASPINGRGIVIDVLANDSDPDGDPVTLVDVTAPPNGTAAIVGSHIEYTPASGYEGTDTFDYTISDGSANDTATVTVTVAGFVGWAWTLQVLKGDGTPWYEGGWVLGMGTDATDGYDEGIDALAPPASPDGTGAWFAIGGGTGPNEKLQTDYRSQKRADLWKLVVRSWPGASWGITWDPNAVPSGMPWPAVIQEADEDWQPIGDPTDMSTTDHVDVGNPTGDLRTSRWLICFGPEFVAVDLAADWNLVSVPVEPDNPATDAVFPDCTVYAYNAVSASYYAPATIEAKHGYWVHTAAPRRVIVSGTPPADPSVQVTTIWNLICPVESSYVPTYPAISTYAYDAGTGSYYTPIRCIPGIGYWVCALGDGEIWPPAPPGSAFRAAAQTPAAHWAFTIQLLQGDGTTWHQGGWVIGTQDGASGAYDIDIDNPAPPAKLDSSRGWLEIGDGLTDMEKLQTDLRSPTAAPPQWKLRLRVPPGETWRITWDPSGIPSLVDALTLTPADASWQPAGTAVNMSQQSSLDVPNPSGDLATRRFLIDAGGYNLPPSDFACSDVTTTSVTWTWTDNSTGETSFRVDPPGQSVGANVTSCTETGLAPNTPYTRWVVAVTPEGETVPSNTDSLHTLAEHPPSGGVTIVSSSRIDVGWLTGSNPDGTDYRCQCYEGDTFDPDALAEDTGWTTLTSHTFVALTPNTLYTFRSCARNHDGRETAWTVLGGGSFYTRSNPPGDLDVDTRVLDGDRLNLTAPACNSVTLLDIGLNDNPEDTELAIRLGDGPGAKWLQFGRGDPLTDTDHLFAVSDEPCWHTVAEWRSRRLRGLTPDTDCVLHAVTRDGSGQTSSERQVAAHHTSLLGDVNSSGFVNALDYALVRAGMQRGGVPGATCSWACDVRSDGMADALDARDVWERAMNPAP